MSMEESLHVVFNGLLKIQSLLDDTKGFADFLEIFKKNTVGSNEGVEIVKNLVDQLYNESVNIKEAFNKVYDELIETDSLQAVSEIQPNLENSENHNETNTSECNTNKNLEIIDNSKLTSAVTSNNEIEGNTKDISETELLEYQHGEDSEEQPADDANITFGVEKGKDKSMSILGTNNKSLELVEDNEENIQTFLNDTNDNGSKCNHEDNVNTAVDTDQNLNDEDLQNINTFELCSDSQVEEKPVIRLVDLSKLMNPKSKKDDVINSSLIVISSDDEPNTIDQNGILKSSRSSRRQKEMKTKQKVNYRDASLGQKSDDQKKNHEISSERSNSDNESNFRSSSRLKIKQNLKTKSRECLKNLFQHRSKRDNSKKIDNNNFRDTNRIRCSKQPKVLSHYSSSSDEDDREEKNQRNTCKKFLKDNLLDFKEDKKFSCKVYIPLVLIECEKLKEVYLRNKEIFEIKRLTNLKTLKRPRNCSPTSSSGDEFQKVTSERYVKKRNLQKSDDEQSVGGGNIRETVEKKSSKSNEIVANEQKEIPEMILEELKDLDEDKIYTDGSNSEKENETKETNKPSKNEKPLKTKNKEEDLNNLDEEETDTKDNNSKKGSKDKKINEKSKSDKLTETNNKMEKLPNLNDEKTDTDENDLEKEHEITKTIKKSNRTKTNSKEVKLNEDEKENTDKLNEERSKSIDSYDKKDKKSDDENEKIKRKTDKRLDEQSDSPDSDEDFTRYNKRKGISRNELLSDTELSPQPMNKRKIKKRMKKITVISDSDDSDRNENKNEESEWETSDSSSSDEGVVKKKPMRKRIKRTKESSSDDEDDKSTRKHIRKVIDVDALSETTKKAEADEKERKARVLEKQKKYNQIMERVKDSKVENLILEYDEENKKDLLPVHKHFLTKMKPHQASGVRFMWDACFESLKLAKKETGGGCILAHCMGLGKTLQVIILSHTLLTNEKKTNVNRIMVVCPINTVLNWKTEFKAWMPKNSEVEVFELVSCKKNYERQCRIQEWSESGGVLLIGYTMFRMLSNPDNKKISKKMRTIFLEGLVDPGPDLVVCDEGHLLKNEKSHLSIAMSRIKTRRRIVLTGTPLQNNLKEYWCMVQFIKPNLLGTYKEYMNRFVNPITNGQYTDSTQHDINVMRKRSHVLHTLLDGVVQRRDYSVLEPYLPPKHEYVIFIKLSEVQIKMYKHYMDRFARRNDGSNRTAFLFSDFQALQRICTHPRVLLDKSIEKKEKDYDDDEESEGSLKDFIDDRDVSSSSASSSSGSESNSESGLDNSKNKSQKKRITRARAAADRRENNEESDHEPVEVKKDWWQEYCDGDELDNIKNSGKLFLLFEILKECEEIGDKILVFSQSLYTLNCIEYFLEKIDECTENGDTEKLGGYSGSWTSGLDYFRIDGSSSCDNRAAWCNMFNDPKNIRSRLFLISTKAGGLGINLVAANRVIIFDVSWNPSHDIQSIYRVYRFGQTKPCYVYRFVTYGTMEMKIYERQVIKQAISKRVIDEQQIDRHYNQNDIQELYKCDLEPEDRPLPMVPKDVLLGEMLQKYDKTIYKYHLHQSLLENKECEELNEEERKAAWEEFESEKIIRKTYNNSTFFSQLSVNAQTIAAALTNIVKKDNPTWPDHQIKGIIPALVKQLQVQLSENDTSMYTRVQQEIQLMQAIQKQQMSEAFYQQQVMRMIQQQQARHSMLGNLNVNPASFAPSFYPQFFPYPQGGPSSARPAPARTSDNVVIDLND